VDEEAVIAIVLLGIVGGGITVVVLAVQAFVRVGRLEKEVAALKAARGMPAAPPPVGPAPVPAAAPPPVSAVAEVPAPAAPVPATPALAGSEDPALRLTPPPVHSGFQDAKSKDLTPPRAIDWEAIVAGRWLFRVGLLAVAVGVSYFLKLAIDNDWIGPTGQVALGILAGVTFLAAAPSILRRGYAFFADGLSGLGAAILYLSIWAGSSYYALFSTTVGFGAMAVVTAAMIAVALGRDSQRLAVLALIGGFVTPILVSTGRDAQLVLFTYLAILNGGLLPIAWRRGWRAIELPAFVLTQLYFWGWYGRFYTDEKLPLTAFFAAIFFVEFVAVPALRARRIPRLAEEHIFLVPLNAGLCLTAFGAMLWPEHRWALTGVALALAAAHLAAANVVPAADGSAPPARLLFGGVALMLATVAIPLRLDGQWITIAWAVEGAILMWTSFATRMRAMRALAFLVLAVALWRAFAFPSFESVFLFNARFLADLVTVLCGGVALWVATRHRADLTAADRVPLGVLSVVVNLLALKTLTSEVNVFFLARSEDLQTGEIRDLRLAAGLAISVLWALYASALVAIGMRTKVAAWRWQGLALFAVTAIKVFFVDLAVLSGVYRVLSSIVLGVVLLVVSFVYQRRLAAARTAAPVAAKAEEAP
jgi:uncharacterized membrane protein